MIYQHAPGQSAKESAMQAAAYLVSEKQKTDVLLSSISQQLEQDIISTSSISLANLLNPVNTSKNVKDPAQSINIRPSEHDIKALVFNDQNGAHLANTSLLAIRSAHDSQVKKHHGNERAKVLIENLKSTSINNLNPSECSKLVAVVMKSTEVTPTGVSRIHRWNMTMKLNLSHHMNNTSTSLGLPSHAIISGGGISKQNPIEYEKFVVIIKNGVSIKGTQNH